MNKLQKLNLDFPDENTKFYREKMGYKNQQLRMLLGYKDELENGNRNFFFNQWLTVIKTIFLFMKYVEWNLDHVGSFM